MKKIFIFALLTIVMIGCAKKAEQTAVESPVVAGDWKIAQFGEMPIVATDSVALPELQIAEDGTFHLYAGCNQINGAYELEGEQITWKDCVSTKMMCPNIEMEDAILQLLNGTYTITADGEALMITDEAGAPVLRLVK